MNVTYDPEAGAFYLKLRKSSKEIARTENAKAIVNLDIDKEWYIVGIEIVFQGKMTIRAINRSIANRKRRKR